MAIAIRLTTLTLFLLAAAVLYTSFSGIDLGRLSPQSLLEQSLSNNAEPISSPLTMDDQRVVAYYVNWAIYGRNHQPFDIPYQHLTHVLYAFANIRDTGEVYLTDTWSDIEKHYPSDSWNDSGTNVYGCIKQLYLLKKKNRNLKILLSIGGWTYSKNFAGPASTPAGRQKFAQSAVQLLQDLALDGIDVDWEYPASEQEGADFVALMQETRKALDGYSASQQSNHMLLTIACSAGPHNWRHLRLRELTPLLDFYGLMAYDFAGSWDGSSGHQANLYPSKENPQSTPFSTHVAVQHYLSHDVPPSKLVVGLPLYGRAFENTKGPGEPFSGIGEGSWEQGVWDFKALPRPGAEEMVDKNIGASWSFDKNRNAIVSYDNTEIARQKVSYIRENRLSGAMFWETSGDKTGDDGLIPTVFGALSSKGSMDQSNNQLSFKDSKYDNIRAGMPNE